MAYEIDGFGNVRDLTLERVRFWVNETVSQFELQLRDGVEWRRLSDRDGYERRWMMELLGKQIEKTVTYPADWWQAVKARWFPTWALRRWPARMCVVTFQASEVLPLVKVPPGGKYVRLALFDRYDYTTSGKADER